MPDTFSLAAFAEMNMTEFDISSSFAFFISLAADFLTNFQPLPILRAFPPIDVRCRCAARQLFAMLGVMEKGKTNPITVVKASMKQGRSC